VFLGDEVLDEENSGIFVSALLQLLLLVDDGQLALLDGADATKMKARVPVNSRYRKLIQP
jgi:hypothetical protein